MAIKIALMDESAIFLVGLKKLLIEAEIEVVGEASSIVSAKSLIQKSPPDVLLLNAELSDGLGVMVCDFATVHFPDIKTVFILNDFDGILLSRLMSSSARGFMTKNSGYAISEVIQSVYYGKTYLQPDIGLRLVRFVAKSPLLKHYRLKDREYQVLLMTCRGKTTEEISDLLALSDRTIANLKSIILKKLGVNDFDQININYCDI